MPLMTSYLYIWFISMVRKEAARLITVRSCRAIGCRFSS